MIIIMTQTMELIYPTVEEFQKSMHLYTLKRMEKLTYFIKKE